jgi:hypothetical protein
MRSLVCALSLTAACSGAATQVHAPLPPDPIATDVGPPPEALVAAWELSPVYTKHLDVDGLPVLASAQVSDYALREARYLIRQMIGHRPEIIDAMVAHRVRVVVMATTEMTTDIPEHSDLTPRAYWDRRARGLGATVARPATSCGEENLLALDGDPYATESILVHELSHTIHQLAVADLDPGFEARLAAAYQAARDAGRWAHTYAMANPAEYWAEGAQSWFDANRADDEQHGPIRTRAQLVEYDPELAALLAEVFGDRAWRYLPPDQRQPAERAHLDGFDRRYADRFAWPEASPVEEEVVSLPLLAPGAAPLASPPSRAATRVVVVNRRDADLTILWLDFAGNPVRQATIRPGAMQVLSTFVGHTWLLREGSTELGAVVAAEKPGRVEVR